jgi:hypothetical protein
VIYKNELGRIVQCMGIADLAFMRGGVPDREQTALRRGFANTAAVFKAATPAISTGSGFTIPDNIAQNFVGDEPRNSIALALNAATRDYGLRGRVIVTDNDSVVAQETSEGTAIEVAGLAAESIVITPSRCSIVIPYTRELIESANAGAVIEADARLALARGLDAAILQRLVPGSAGGITASANPHDDMKKLFTALALTGYASPLLCASVDIGILASVLHQSGQAAFPEMTVSGGRMDGAEVYVSDRLASESLLAVDPASVAMSIADVEVMTSTNAAVELSTSPTQNLTSGQGAQMVSAFQTGLVLLRLNVRFSIALLRGERVSETLESITWANS